MAEKGVARRRLDHTLSITTGARMAGVAWTTTSASWSDGEYVVAITRAGVERDEFGERAATRFRVTRRMGNRNQLVYRGAMGPLAEWGWAGLDMCKALQSLGSFIGAEIERSRYGSSDGDGSLFPDAGPRFREFLESAGEAFSLDMATMEEEVEL